MLNYIIQPSEVINDAYGYRFYTFEEAKVEAERISKKYHTTVEISKSLGKFEPITEWKENV